MWRDNILIKNFQKDLQWRKKRKIILKTMRVSVCFERDKILEECVMSGFLNQVIRV